MLDPNRVVVADRPSGGGRVIAGLVVAAVLFLTLLSLFGETMFSGGKPGDDHSQQPMAESKTK